MLTLNCQAILFDLDGTLIDSTIRIQRLWVDWGSRHGIPPQSILEVMHGRRAGETISLVAPHLSVKDEVFALETDEIADMNGVTSYPGAVEMISKLSPGQWAVVTSGSLRVAGARMRHVALPIPEVFITGDDVRAGKPAPEGYLLAAERLNVRPEDCVVLEDAPAGVQAGKAAGMQVIGVATTLPAESLSPADVVVDRLTDILLTLHHYGIQIGLKNHPTDNRQRDL